MKKYMKKAFFLSYALGCLKVFKKSEELRYTELWQTLSNLDKDFIYKYIVYHKLRSKGWILKNGIKVNYYSFFLNFIFLYLSMVQIFVSLKEFIKK